MTINYRLVTEADEAFLYRLHREAMRELVEETWGEWDEDWQRAYFQRDFEPRRLRIIQYDGQDVGVLSVEDRAEELFLANIEILPAFQRRGIGTAVIGELIAEGERLGKPIALKVLKANREARDLYQRLGFNVTGGNDTHHVMAWGVSGGT